MAEVIDLENVISSDDDRKQERRRKARAEAAAYREKDRSADRERDRQRDRERHREREKERERREREESAAASLIGKDNLKSILDHYEDKDRRREREREERDKARELTKEKEREMDRDKIIEEELEKDTFFREHERHRERETARDKDPFRPPARRGDDDRAAPRRHLGDYSIARGNGVDPLLIHKRGREADADADAENVERSKRRRGDSDASKDAHGLTVIQRQMAKMRTIKVKPRDEVMEKKKNRCRRDIIDNNVHWSEKGLDEMTERDWRIFREDFQIVTKGAGVPHPLRCWGESGLLPARIVDAIEDFGYKDPSPVQMQSIPIALQNRDVIGIAQTGSGKTAAFVIPMCVYISRQPPLTADTLLDGPYALVMAPTRELAQQIEDEAARFGRYLKQRVISVVGGVGLEQQANLIRMGAEIIIGTPGRVVDCIERKYLVLNQCNYIVLDEADRMIDMGFESQVKAVMDFMPSSNTRPENEADEEKDRVYRQTFMFSATMPATVEKLAQKYLRRPVSVQIGEVGTPIDRIDQRITWTTSESQKRQTMLEILRTEQPPIIIFCNTKDKVDSLAKMIEGEGFSVCTLRGGKSQDQRSAALDGFKTQKFDVLVATDIAARGIDVKNITHVINYDMPKTIEFYTHRIGRTGRAGSKGVAVSFLTPQDTEVMFDLHSLLVNCKAQIPKELSQHECAKAKPGTPEFNTQKRRETVILSKKTQNINLG
eukprot:TRINITY_DN10751_c0_g1_i1.p1 TRINITY_DN10751_c0_g1~~TRINITY_DN10751_c0_g1_i1.p1  ORF type:complete len:753 (+),score=170.84 TRINITY_DN10751_c0_g1_i1:101-2260(+)